MDLDQLTAFERIARERSFSQAAWDLGIPQPTISARIQALEREVGGALFFRSGRRVTLTDLGSSFSHSYARRALEVLREGLDAARLAQDGQRGRVTIGVLESLSGSLLGPVLANYHAVAPQVEVYARAARHDILIDWLRDGMLSLALIAWPCTDAVDLPLDVLFTMRERVVLVAAPDHPLARKGIVDQDTILAEAQPFLLLQRRQMLDPLIARLAQRATSVVDVPMNTARQMVLSGTGAGFFTWMQVVDALAAGQLVEIGVADLAPITRGSALVHLKRSAPLDRAARTLVDLLREHATRAGLVEAGTGRPAEHS